MTRTLGGERGALRQFLAEPSTRLQEAFNYSDYFFCIFFLIFFLSLLYFLGTLLGFADTILEIADTLIGFTGSLLEFYY